MTSCAICGAPLAMGEPSIDCYRCVELRRLREQARAPVAMKRIAVAWCGGCPFNRRGSIDWCDLGEQETRRSTVRPDWCPLDLGPVTVEVERG